MRSRTSRLILSLFPLLLLLVASEARAATYYVRNGGNDNADGRSDATAWATIGKVNAYSFTAGDSVLFHEGDVFTGGVLNVDWGGTSSGPAVIGAYYVDNGVERRGLRNARPTIDGQDKLPSTRWIGLINVLRDHVRVENLAFINSEGMGARFVGANFGQAVNLVTSNTYDAGIRFQSCNDALVEGNHVTDAARAWPEDGQTAGSTVRWASAIVVHDQSLRAVIRGNVVTNVFGEGINVWHGSSDAIIEDNFVFGARALGIYADSSPRLTIRRNLVVGTTDSQFWRSGDTVGSGIVLNNEPLNYQGGSALDPSVQATDAKIYSNLVAYTLAGIAVWGQSTNRFNNTLIYNNTLVDNQTQFRTLGVPMPGSELIDNILYSVSPGTKDVSGTSSGLTAKDNYFSQGDPGGPYSDAGNRYSGLQLARMTGWRTFHDSSEVSWRDFQPTANSTTNGAGSASADALAPLLDFNSQPYDAPLDMGGLRKSLGKVPKSPALLSTSR